ncbi:MAG: 2-oxoglutarate ferredoxin oxidoreductase subunit gamma [Desulfobacterales bacterium]|nr:MAG: 2-oxoglutarate ferredoxin oxidoreductase subunit gamma [Desulfobacterales bacterium]
MTRYRIIFSGSGGQGLVSAAIILAESAVMYNDLEAVQSQSYGAAARGGATRSDVIISDAPINMPKIIQPEILICMTQEAYSKFNHLIRPGGLLISDSKYVKTARRVDARQIELPIYQTVMEEIGKPVVFNIAVLGVLIGMRGIVKKESVEKVLATRFPPAFMQGNQMALDLGFEMGFEYAE